MYIPEPSRYNPTQPDTPHYRAMRKSGSGRFVLYKEWQALRQRINELERLLETRELIERVLDNDNTHPHSDAA
jgi:hypothetical protein